MLRVYCHSSVIVQPKGNRLPFAAFLIVIRRPYISFRLKAAQGFFIVGKGQLHYGKQLFVRVDGELVGLHFHALKRRRWGDGLYFTFCLAVQRKLPHIQ